MYVSVGREASGMHGHPSMLKSALFADVFCTADVVNIILLLTYRPPTKQHGL